MTIGKDSVSAKTFLERLRALVSNGRYHDDLEMEDAIHTALLTLREGFEGEMDETNIEVGIIKDDKKFQFSCRKK
ncbi:hypothetical protein PsorP6_017653 [Peronosclerospora sorghi]|uniref:Uncharacterized protein n=1 Tax=Peronosclerospora sorghi TaxID=230839 RepID=A0ACC0WLU8_9STRA|nr:hypothetical protein PsorP6_017653 [Peronosclerospora sorghi]